MMLLFTRRRRRLLCSMCKFVGRRVTKQPSKPLCLAFLWVLGGRAFASAYFPEVLTFTDQI